MESHILTGGRPLPAQALQQIANGSPLDEISNAAGSVRHHIYFHGPRDRSTDRLDGAILFLVYQTTRHGPQNGFRLVLVRSGFHIPSPAKLEPEAEEDDIDRLEKPIPQGHMEVVILGDVDGDGDDTLDI